LRPEHERAPRRNSCGLISPQSKIQNRNCMSRQSDSNRRPADYKSAALNQLSYAGVSPYESRF
jgi:hypothetical protein